MPQFMPPPIRAEVAPSLTFPCARRGRKTVVPTTEVYTARRVGRHTLPFKGAAQALEFRLEDRYHVVSVQFDNHPPVQHVFRKVAYLRLAGGVPAPFEGPPIRDDGSGRLVNLGAHKVHVTAETTYTGLTIFAHTYET